LTNIPHVVILGGGFGGLSAANELRNTLSSSQVKITVIDKKDWFMVGFAKLWIINGTRTFENSTGSLNELQKKEIDFIKDEILSINFENKNVKTKKKEKVKRVEYVYDDVELNNLVKEFLSEAKDFIVDGDYHLNEKSLEALNQMKGIVWKSYFQNCSKRMKKKTNNYIARFRQKKSLRNANRMFHFIHTRLLAKQE